MTDAGHIYNPWNVLNIGEMLTKNPGFIGVTDIFLHLQHGLS